MEDPRTRMNGSLGGEIGRLPDTIKQGPRHGLLGLFRKATESALKARSDTLIKGVNNYRLVAYALGEDGGVWGIRCYSPVGIE